MRKVFVLVLIAMSFFSFSAWQWTKGASAEEELIRFHVIANSDDPTDQEVKLKVRDAILFELSPLLSVCGNPHEAYDLLVKNKGKMDQIAEDTLISYGFHYGAEVVIGKDLFPTKKYGDVTLSAGEYEAVRIVLGEGEGKNWWCVMFPPLCFVDISQNVGIAKLEKVGISDNGEAVPAGSQITEVKMTSKFKELLD